MVQRALVLLGSASHSTTLKRRKIAWARINPSLKSLATEKYEDRKDNLFGPDFLKNASKKLEVDKALAKAAAPPPTGREAILKTLPTYAIFCPMAPQASMAARDHSSSQSHTNPNSNKRGTTRITGETSGTRNKNVTSPSRESTFLLASLEANQSGSLGSGGGEGLPVGTGTNPLPDQPGNISGQISNGTPGN